MPHAGLGGWGKSKAMSGVVDDWNWLGRAPERRKLLGKVLPEIGVGLFHLGTDFNLCMCKVRLLRTEKGG